MSERIESRQDLIEAEQELLEWYRCREFPCSDEELEAANTQIPLLEQAINEFKDGTRY